MKKFLAGLIVGALLFSIIPVGAAVQEYVLQKSSAKLVVNGAEYANKDLPVLNYKGYNYMPADAFRGICETIGAGFKWDNSKKEVQIEVAGQAPVKEDDKVSETITQTRDGLRVIELDGELYSDALCSRGNELFRPNSKRPIYYAMQLISDKNDGIYTFARLKKITCSEYIIDDEIHYSSLGTEEILIDNITVYFILNDYFIKYEYYVNTVLPLIK